MKNSPGIPSPGKTHVPTPAPAVILPRAKQNPERPELCSGAVGTKAHSRAAASETAGTAEPRRGLRDLPWLARPGGGPGEKSVVISGAGLAPPASLTLTSSSPPALLSRLRAAQTLRAGHQAPRTSGENRLPNCLRGPRASSPSGPVSRPRPARGPLAACSCCQSAHARLPGLTLEIHADPAIASALLTAATAVVVERVRAAGLRSPPRVAPPLMPRPTSGQLQYFSPLTPCSAPEHPLFLLANRWARLAVTHQARRRAATRK